MIEIIALIISLFSAGFVWYTAYLMRKEQRLRLRPWIYTELTSWEIDKTSIKFMFSIKNVGLILGRNITSVCKLQIGDTIISSSSSDYLPLIVPNQILKNSVILRDNIIQDFPNTKPKLMIRLIYHDNIRQYYYEASSEYDHGESKWMIIGGNAD